MLKYKSHGFLPECLWVRLSVFVSACLSRKTPVVWSSLGILVLWVSRDSWPTDEDLKTALAGREERPLPRPLHIENALPFVPLPVPRTRHGRRWRRRRDRYNRFMCTTTLIFINTVQRNDDFLSRFVLPSDAM